MANTTLKAFLIPKIRFIIIAGFTGISWVTGCQAQSIVGKWNQVSSKQMLTEQGAKSYGKTVLETDMSTIGVVVYEFKADHTYTLTSTALQAKASRVFNGTWSITGNELTMSSNGSTIKSKTSIQENQLTLDTAYPNSKITSEVIVTFKRS